MAPEWHTQASSYTAHALASDERKGLGRREAARRLKVAGPNRLTMRKRPGIISIFASQFKDPMVLTLLAATVVSAAMRETLDAAVIAAIVVVNAVLGTVQEHRAESSLEALENYAPPSAWVIRDGEVVEIARESVVPGDLITLWPGTRVPADGRLVSSRSLQAEEAALTGESLPSSKDAHLVLQPRVTLPERKNMVYGGTLVTRGEGVALVVATGMDTEMGKIAGMVGSATTQTTPLEQRLQSLGKVILISCMGICVVLVALGLLRGLPFHDMFLTGVSLAVAAVPEGLPAVVTLSFAFGVQRMVKNGAIVRRLEAIETLGSITVICADKTGTLTKNRMEVVGVAGPEDLLSAAGAISRDVNRERLWADILRVALLASDARHMPGGSETTGEDPTEQAIVAGAHGAGLDVLSLDERCPRVFERSFTPERRMMSVKVQTEEGALVCVKGASDTVIPVCRSQMVNGRVVALGDTDRQAWVRWVEARAAQGMRVLAVAERREGVFSRSVKDYEEDDLCLRGCLSMADPLRPEAGPGVERCKKAGIRPVLITGDHLLTAESVARQAGILSPEGRGMTGEMLERIPPGRLKQAIDECRVFARVSPAHKLKIVRNLKALGHVVAMTGDGVNDAPALKEAAVGVAMGLTGTDVARQASSMVLLDDNFSTIVKAVEEGRSIYDNVRKFIRYLFSCNLGEVITMLVATAFGLPLPLSAAELLWMNLVTDGLPALALSRDPPDKDIMSRPPRDPAESLFARGLWRRIVTRGVYVGGVTLLVFIWSLSTAGLEVASTMAYATLVTVQLIAAFDCRSEEKSIAEMGLFSNMYLALACALSWLMLLVTIQWKPLSSLFRTVPLSVAQWAVVFLCSVFPDLFGAAFSGRKE